MAGCGGIKLVPVSGKVTLNGQPLVGGGVNFVPDPEKGNQAAVACVGRIDSKGQYELRATHGAVGKGAPLGWYKVTLTLTQSDTLPERAMTGAPQAVVPGKYLDAEQTPLSIEVVAEPVEGMYDLPLTAESAR
jgi:hypothetical protein